MARLEVLLRKCKFKFDGLSIVHLQEIISMEKSVKKFHCFIQYYRAQSFLDPSKTVKELCTCIIYTGPQEICFY